MANLVPRPANGASPSVGRSVEIPRAVNSAGVIGRWNVFPDEFLGRARAPANDNGQAGPGAALSKSPLLWLDLVEVDGHVLLAANFDGDVDALRAPACSGRVRDVELAVNTIFLDQLFDVGKFAEDELMAFGNVICESLRARAARAFPGRRFAADVISVGPARRIGVRLFQCDRRTVDA